MILHVYIPVDSGRSEIRLLKSTRRKKSRMRSAPNPGRFIILNSQRFPVFENLFAALVRLRHASRTRTIWIDAVCINQSETQEAVEEREQQILLMGRIYEQAQKVVIWLGNTGIGEDIAMQSLANPSGNFSLYTKIWKTERKFGLGKGLKNRMSQGLSGERDGMALQVVELAQLLDRKGWRRVWIIQEAVLAKKATLMCGPDEVSWAAIAKRLRDGMAFLAVQEEWRSGSWNRTLYDLLYTFRRCEATKPRDRIYAFLGLASDVEPLGIVPDYTSPTSKIYTDNYQQQSQFYCLLDQIRFVDPDALVVEGEGKLSRKGWAKLPHGWERCQLGSRFHFYNHLSGKYQETSPLAGQPPASPQHMEHWQNLPSGWQKTWDNLGNTKLVFNPDDLSPDQVSDLDLQSLPSWVPDWTRWSSKDSEPLPSLTDVEPRYWASGKARQVHFASGYDSDSTSLRLTELHLLPIDRLQNKVLQDCPYGNSEDYAGSRSATDKEKNYFETWANRGQWASMVPENFSATDKSSWQKSIEIPTQQMLMGDMATYMIEKGYEKANIHPVKNFKVISGIVKDYKSMRRRIHSASIGRAMFVTSKGFIGLAPWNAKEGDIVSVLFGGCTPFVLRQIAGKELYTPVGEAYVHEIMGGELFSGEMGHARLRAFDVV
ncbi:heterokaryon incompatibility protein-domain-containing protein [Cadophora sp. MPI-SDFR-AT-0126]|nr:heterokaryon incompatibility protein-domain-containing protein [Leotiomycetes sp. MPI-SDFR-AT-0126]